MRSPHANVAAKTRWLGLLALCSLALAACGKSAGSAQPGAGSSPTSAAGAASAAVQSAPPAVAPSQVASLVSAATSIRALPGNIEPALQNAAQDQGTFLAQSVYGDVNGRRVSCNPDWTQVQVPACVWGDPNGAHTLVLMGDSHAAQWISAFDQIGKRIHWKIVLLTKSACGAPDISFYDYANKGAYPACDQWHTYAISRINQLDPSIVVLASDADYALNGSGALIAAPTWTAGLVKTLDSITAPGVQKVVLGDVPVLGTTKSAEVASQCLSLHPSSVQACSTPASVATGGGLRQADQAGARQGGATYIDVTPWFCSTTCTAVVGNLLVYADAGHMTNEYATFLSGELQAALEQDAHLS